MSSSEMPAVPTLIVGNARSGGTMLARILNTHPDVLCVNEFFSTLKSIMRGGPIPAADMDGDEFWGMISAAGSFFDALLVAGLGYPELCYPYGSGRFDAVSGVPRICHMTLPVLSQDPDELFDRLAAEVPSWPRRPAGVQYRALFGFLAQVLGRRVVVERSSRSAVIATVLHEQFPEARFVHLHRNGPDCAISMEGHAGFRLKVLRLEALKAAGLSVSSWEQVEQQLIRAFETQRLPAEYITMLAPPFDSERIMTAALPISAFGGLWAFRLSQGLGGLTQLPPGSWTNFAYEDLCRDPDTQLTWLAHHIGVEPLPGWLATARKWIAKRPNPQASSVLDPEALASLRAACEPGAQAIASAEAARVAQIATTS